MSVRGSNKSKRLSSNPYSVPNNVNQQQNSKIYVGNLSWEVKWQDLKDHMKQAGNVIRADIPLDNLGRSKGYGIVEFASRSDAQKAINLLQNTELLGRTIFLKEDRENNNAIPVLANKPWIDINAIQGKRLYVGNISFETTWQQLKDFMKTAGNVTRADILTDPTGRSKGCGIVEYNTIEEARNAVMNLNQTFFNGRPIFIREDREDKKTIITTENNNTNKANEIRHIGCNLFVGNIAFDVTWQEIKDHFKKVIPVKHVQLFQEPNGQSKGSAIVELESSNDAITAIGKLNNSMLKGRQIFVREDKEEIKHK